MSKFLSHERVEIKKGNYEEKVPRIYVPQCKITEAPASPLMSYMHSQPFV